ncbi:MAG: ABC transporter ATP-binding protein [Rhizobiales bacterium]|nr:ABC transporter ATP-binding protein [Hyphomicrobiales bacterium]
MSGPLLVVDDLSVAYGACPMRVRALDAARLTVEPGETVALIGESGSGKTTLALAVIGLLDPAARVEGGRILIEGRDALGLSPRERAALRGRIVGMALQSARGALNPSRSVGAHFVDALEGTPRARVAEIAEATLARLGVDEPRARLASLPHELSVGLARRVGLALATARRPRLLIVDEPTSGLDAESARATLALLRAALAETGGACLVLTHDLALAERFADRVAVMCAGQIVETAPARAFFARPRHPYAAALLASAPARARALDDLSPIGGGAPDLCRADLPACRFAERCARRDAACAAPPWTSDEQGSATRCAHPL